MNAENPPRTPMTWTIAWPGTWMASGRDGVDWEVHDRGGSGASRFAITIAQWDRPDWWAPTLEAAKRLAEEIDARAPIPPEERIPESRDFVPPPGEEYAPFDSSVPAPTGPCDCGSDEAPEAVKPASQTSAWWEDPSAFWRCPACGGYRGDADPIVPVGR